MPFIKHKPRGNVNWRPKDRTALCKGCGAEYDRLFCGQRYCSAECRVYKQTPQDRMTLATFQNLCEKYHLSAAYTFGTICRSNRQMYYRLASPKKFLANGHVGGERMKMYYRVVEKFNRDFQNGCYDMVEKRAGYYGKKGNYSVIVRRLNPLPRHCPRGLSHCAGGILAHSCPRQFKECELAQ